MYTTTSGIYLAGLCLILYSYMDKYIILVNSSKLVARK